MADLSITASAVVPDPGANIVSSFAGEAVTAGMAVYLKSDQKWWKALTTTTAEAGATNLGIALTGSGANQAVSVMTGGTLTIGATVAATGVYILSTNAGGICPVADLASSKYLSFLCYGISTTKVTMNKLATGIAKA